MAADAPPDTPAPPPGRRRLLALAGAALLPAPALAQPDPGDFPARPLRVVVAAPTGGGPDTLFRLVQPRLAEFLGQPIAIENRAGAAGAIAGALVAAAPPDGHTLLFDDASLLTVPFLNRALPFDYESDLAPVAGVAEIPFILAVATGTGIRDLRGYLDQARIATDAMPYGTPGVGDVGHLAGALLSLRTGLRMEHIAYRSGPRVARDLANGTLPSAYLPAEPLAPLLAAGRAHPIAVTGAARRGGIDGVPTVAEQGFPGFDLTNWHALLSPAGIPPAARRRLQDALDYALRDREVRGRMAAMGAFPVPVSDRLEDRMARDRALLRDLIPEAGIVPG